jgi:TM2 domain-containing membrane protein YozV
LSGFDARFNSLQCLKDASAYSRKNENLYVIASAIVPGSGSMLNGYIGKGINSLLLNAASATGIALLVKHQLYINAVIWGGMVGLKFYVGNILLTKSLFERKEQLIKNQLANNCELIVKELLEDYPLNFR